MTPREIQLVQDSFEKVIPVADTAAATFYQRLFHLDPSLQLLFHTDIKEQGKKLMDALRAVVGNLRTLDRVVPGIEAMARRHVKYGVQSSDYATVGVALIETLQLLLGRELTEETRMAWLSAYTTLADVMIAATEEAELQTA